MKKLAVRNKVVLIVTFCCTTLLAQKKSEQLAAEQKRIEKQLSSTQNLLQKVKKNKDNSLNELKLVTKQVADREQLVQNVDNQIRGTELSISSKDNQVKQLKTRILRLKQQYRKLLLYAYKHRNRYGKMMYVISSKNYFEAKKRNSYLKRIADLQQKQFKLIKQNSRSIYNEIISLKEDKANKEELLQTKIEERDLVLKDKLTKEATLAKYKKDEKKLQAELKANEKKKADLKKKIKSAIEKEIAEAEAKAKKSQAKKETKSSGSSTASSGSSSSSKSTSKEIVPTETKESLAMSKSFEGNRGKLPWPVLKGTIVEGYGKNPHPTLANVFTNNNGIDIGAPKNAQVRTVFEGEVSSIISIPGAGKCVIIKHGAYRTVYSNLQDVFVSVGTKVSTKQAIGSLLSEEGSSISTAHFELHQVVNGSPQRINPTLWLAN